MKQTRIVPHRLPQKYQLWCTTIMEQINLNLLIIIILSAWNKYNIKLLPNYTVQLKKFTPLTLGKSKALLLPVLTSALHHQLSPTNYIMIWTTQFHSQSECVRSRFQSRPNDTLFHYLLLQDSLRLHSQTVIICTSEYLVFATNFLQTNLHHRHKHQQRL